MKLIIRKIKIDELDKLDIKCATCTFWFNCSRKKILDGWGGKNIIDFLKAKLYGRAKHRDKTKKIIHFCRYGGRIMGAFEHGKCIGMLLYGRHYLFPNLSSFNVFPPDNDCVFIGCIYVKPGYRDMGVGQRLILSIERELLKKRIRSIEIIGQRNTDTKEGRVLVPVKFLIKNGFYIHKNDCHYPLLRLDLDSIVKDFDLEKVLKKHLPLNKRLEMPGRYYNR